MVSDYTFNIVTTPNTADPDASADFLDLPSAFSTTSFAIGGTTYNVKLTGFGDIVGDGFLASDSLALHVREGGTASADLFAEVTTEVAAVPEPQNVALMFAGLGMMGLVAAPPPRLIPRRLVDTGPARSRWIAAGPVVGIVPASRQEDRRLPALTSKETIMAATLRALVSALEDDPYCGTRPPHWPGGPLRLGSIQDIIASSRAAVELNPQPLPPLSRDAAAVAFQQVRLFQLGQSLQAHGGAAAEIGGTISGFASEMFDDWCGNVPLGVLIAWLLHHNPPPPQPWWLENISQVVSQLEPGGAHGRQRRQCDPTRRARPAEGADRAIAVAKAQQQPLR